MVFERIDGHGLLRVFSAIPYDEHPAAAPVEMDAVFRAAGLELKNFAETTPFMLPEEREWEREAWERFE